MSPLPAPPGSLLVFASPEMVASSESYSPSAAKPRAVLEDWHRAGLPIDLRAVVPATVEELCRAHDRAFVTDILAGRRANGFGNCSVDVAASLPFTTGAMLTAARHVLSLPPSGVRLACAPVSGFHHAGYAQAAGFCTFNGLVVTALAILAERRARRVVILDCDYHYGDGTDEILARGGFGGAIHHFTAGRSFTAPRHTEAFFARLDAEIAGLRADDLVLYQAGADAHVDDPLGGFLTDAQLRERDARVFAGARRRGAPLVWDLAGGYRRDASGGIAPVLAVHRGTAEEQLSFSRPLPTSSRPAPTTTCHPPARTPSSHTPRARSPARPQVA